jgi:hypothetical protein
MVITEQCRNQGCEGDVVFDLGPHVDREETQVVQGTCTACGAALTLRTNLNRRMR